MVTVCAWCERFLGASDETVVSHGICAPCSARQRWPDTPVIVVSSHRAEVRHVLQELLRGEPAIRILVDRRVGERRRGGPVPAGVPNRGPDRRRRPADAVVM